MRLYEIQVNVVPIDPADSSKGLKFQLGSVPEINLLHQGVVGNALVTWKFKDLPPQMEPAVSFSSTAVTVGAPDISGLGTSEVKFKIEIQYPDPLGSSLTYNAAYTLSASLIALTSGSTISLTPPDLVIDRSLDPPDCRDPHGHLAHSSVAD
jgi:hypothetical protein